MEELMTTNQVARIFQVKKATIALWARQGRIIGTKIGRTWKFTKEEVRRVIKEGV